MTHILCLETATDVCSIAINRDNQVIYQKSLAEGLRHSSALVPMIQEGIRLSGVNISNLDAVAISDGPGSYTGLRVGSSTAKAICYAQDIPMIAISSLEAMAQPFKKEAEIVISTIDARRMEVYAAIYENNELIRSTFSLIWTEESAFALLNENKSLLICGNGVSKAKELITGAFPAVKICPNQADAANMVDLAFAKFVQKDFVDVAFHDPEYHKSPNITRSNKKNLI